MKINYHDKKFIVLSNSDNGEITGDLIFHYQQEGNVLSCQYAGGNIIHGHILGLVHENGEIDFRYQQLNRQGLINTGTCLSKPEIMPDDKIKLHENWQWTSGDLSSGQSTLIEL